MIEFRDRGYNQIDVTVRFGPREVYYGRGRCNDRGRQADFDFHVQNGPGHRGRIFQDYNGGVTMQGRTSNGMGFQFFRR